MADESLKLITLSPEDCVQHFSDLIDLGIIERREAELCRDRFRRTFEREAQGYLPRGQKL